MNQTGTTSTNRLIVEPLSPDFTKALWRLVEDEQRHDPLAPVTVVAPTQYARLALRQELGAAGFANVRFIIFPVLSELLGAAALERRGRKPLSSVLETLTVREVLSQSGGSLTDVWQHPSTQSSVRSAFRQLRDTEPSVREALALGGGVTGEIARLHADFVKRTSGEWYDTEDLAEAAAAAVSAGDAPGLNDLGLIVFYLPHRLPPHQANLMATLAGHHRCAALLGLTGDPGADASTLELRDMLAQTMDPPATSPSTGREIHRSNGSTHLHTAPTAHDELRWVIREIVRELNENHTPLHRMAILFRMADPYAALVRDELRMAGIPMSGPSRESLSNTGAGRVLTGLLELSGSQFLRSDVMAWLSGCPVRNPVGTTPEFSPSQWDVITRKAGIVGGLHQWRDRLSAHARQLNSDADRRETAGEISASRARGMRYEAATAQEILSFIEQLSERLQPPTDGSPWQKFAEWAKELLESYLSRRGEDSDASARERVESSLDGLNAADSLRHGATLSEFRQLVGEMMQAPFGRLGPTGQGVFVSTFAGAAGMNFDAVWLVGMIEGAVPPPPRRDPLLTEPEWLAAGGHDRIRARMADERYDYLAAMASAPRRTLTYPVADAASQRQAYPSRWFLEQATALSGTTVRSGDLAHLRGRDWITADDSTEQAVARANNAALADGPDFRLKRLLEWRQYGRDLRNHPLGELGPLAGAIRLARRRSQRSLTEFDGNLSGVPASERFTVGPGGAPISPTALETWAACPYRYFLGHVLRLGTLDTPEEIFSISALDRGSLTHAILERFMGKSIRDGCLPKPGQSWNSDDRERLMRIAAQAFREAESLGLTGKRLLWDMARTEILADLTTFLDADAALRAATGTADVRVEARFGFGAESTVVADSETGISFRGMIDRIDISDDGKTVLVVDYKSGSASPYAGLDDDPIDQGRRLQLGVYSLAARGMFPEAENVAAAYWFSTNRGGFQFAPASHFNITDPSVAERFRQGVSSIADGINAGLFTANPGPPGRYGPSNCQYCDFDSVCPARRSDLWERKKSDPAIAGFLTLSGTDEEGD